MSDDTPSSDRHQLHQSQGREALQTAAALFVQLGDEGTHAERRERAKTLAANEPAAVREHLLQLLQNYDDAAPGTGSGSETSGETTLLRWQMPTVIGPYQVLGSAGSGGFGLVFKVIDTREQHPAGNSPKVYALKLLPPTSSKHYARRLDDEIRAIKRQRSSKFAPALHDVGHDGTSPFIVMEFIEGKTFLAFARGLSLRDTLRLFCVLCEGVQEMHTRMTIHRDLKDSNILVDSAGLPRILDFGIARLLNLDDPDNVQHTVTSERAGTPDSMSPEQLRGDRNIDARTDVYALGVLLFRMLSGEKPREIASDRSSGRSLNELAEQEAKRLRAVRADLPIDLDAICAKALSVEADRRYATAAALGADIQRFLDSEPVVAVPPSRVYRTRKFIRRNRVLVSSVCVALLGLAATAFVSQRAATRERLLRDQATTSEAKAKTVAGVLKSMLAGIQPHIAMGRDTTIIEQMLNDARDRITRGEFASQPEVEYELSTVVLDGYMSIGKAASALPLAESNFTLMERSWPKDTRKRAECLERRGNVRRVLTQFDAGLKDADEAVALREADSTSTLHERAGALNLQATLQSALMQYDPMLITARKLFAIQEATGDALTIAHARIGLGNAMLQAKQNAEALQVMELCIRGFRETGNEAHPSFGAALHNYAMALDSTGNTPAALVAMEEALERDSKFQPASQPHTFRGRFYKSLLLQKLGRAEEAKAWADSLIALARQAPRDDGSPLPEALKHAGEFHRNRNEFAEAFVYFEECVQVCSDRTIRPTQPNIDLSNALSNAAQCARRLGKGDEAVLWSRHAMDAAKAMAKESAERDPYVIWAIYQYAFCLHVAGRETEATTELERARTLAREHMQGVPAALERIERGFVEKTYP